MPSQAPLKVVRIIGRLNVGGPARQACLLHERLRPEFQTVLITGRPDVGERDMSYLLDSKAGVYRIESMSRPVSLFADLASLFAIYRILRREKPDIVHTHTAKAGTIGRVAAVLAGVPVRIHTFHGHVFAGYFGRFKTRVYLAIERFLARFTTRIVTVSEGQAEELAERYRVSRREKIQVIRNGFDWSDSKRSRDEVRGELGIRPEQTAVLWIGRMVPIKGVPLLAETVRLATTDSSLFFLIAGDGPERGTFEQATQGCEHLRMLGWEEDVAPLWAASDVAVLTSINEGTPTSLIESMFAGKPFVATNAGGTSELAIELAPAVEGVQQARNGFIVERTPDVIAGCLSRLSKDKDLRDAMGRSGRENAAKNWSSERLLQQTTQLYCELAGRSKSKSQGA
jgi:glycosyltransferase involved in cell wall biosynthesis